MVYFQQQQFGKGGGFKGGMSQWDMMQMMQKMWSMKGSGKGNWDRPARKPLPPGTQIDTSATYTGTVVKYDKFRGFGMIEMAQKGVVPGDQVFVYWKSIESNDRFPQLNKDMTVQFSLFQYESKKSGDAFVRAKQVAMPGGGPISVQDSLDAEKKAFVGGQNLRYTGTLLFYSKKTGSGKVKIDQGYAMPEPVPEEIRVEKAEVNCGGVEPFGMKEKQVEFGIWKTRNGLFKVYNMTLPGGNPITREALENRMFTGGQTFTGEVVVNMWKQGYGFVSVENPASLPQNVRAAMQQAKETAKKPPADPNAEVLYFRMDDVSQGVWLKKGQKVQFQVYTDDKGAGAKDITGI